MEMTTALVAMADMERMAQAFAKSALFGTKTPDQCLALMLLAHAEGVHPAIAMRDFDVIQGKPAKKAEAMLRSFLAAGGSVVWHRLEDTGAEATFSHPQGGTVKIGWDEARAKKAGLSGKEMYSKYSRPMYRSRVVSEGCRTVYPAATSGMYVPEEVRAMVREDKRVEKDMGPAIVVPEDQSPAAGGNTAASSSPTVAGADRSKELQELAAKTTITVAAVLAKAGCKTVEEMSDEDYADACAMLKAWKPKAKA